MSTPVQPVNGDRDDAGVRDEQSLADADQTSADRDQTLSDADQTGSDSDQTSSEIDQWAADRDQAISDRNLGAGIDAREYEYTRHVRQRSARRREETSQARLDAAHKRDEIAYSRDLAARRRDHAADARDLAMAQRDAVSQRVDGTPAMNGDEIGARVPAQRRRAADQRAHAADQRVLAAEDRKCAAIDREEAAAERLRALVDREALASQLATAATDPVTGARARAAGLIDLEHEIERCRRMSVPLVLVYLDVIGLKHVNDTVGHDAGDMLLKRLVTLMRERLRPYDLVIRQGGDEFLCAMSAMTMADARVRFTAIAAAQATESPEGSAMRTGFAELAADEAAPELIARADREMVASRHG